MLYLRKKTGLRLIAGAMVTGLMASPAAFAATGNSSCSPRQPAYTNYTHGSIQAAGVVGSDNSMAMVGCGQGAMSMAKSEQAFHTSGTGVQSGTHWILNK